MNAVTTDALWTLIDRTRPADGSPEAHAVAITNELVEAGASAAQTFDAAFTSALDALCSWDLWGAGALLLGGCSDDSFEYVRCWIIGRGRDRWELARLDPERLCVELLADTDREEALVIERIEDLWLLDGEPLLYAAAVALDRLGVERAARTAPPPEPTGAPWDEDDLDERFPRLRDALPPGWWDDARDIESIDGPVTIQVGFTVQGPAMDVIDLLVTGVDAFAAGDHTTCVEALGPIVSDPDRWRWVEHSGHDPVTVAYAVGMSWFIVGDPDAAARSLALVADGDATPDHVRRGMAQVHLARGDLEGAALLLQERSRSPMIEHALRTTLLQRAGEHGAAARTARKLLRLRRIPGVSPHPWDLAGVLVQIGFVFVELGDAKRALSCADSIDGLTRDAPVELPLPAQGRTIRAGALRLLGDHDAALALLEVLVDTSGHGTCDRGLVERELARVHRATGDPRAAEVYRTAATTFLAAGERWLAQDVAGESAAD